MQQVRVSHIGNPVCNVANNPALGPQGAGVQDVKGLSWYQAELKPLKQLGHHHLSLHLEPHHTHAQFVILDNFFGVSMFGMSTCVTHLCKLLSQTGAWSKSEGVVTVVRPTGRLLQ